MLVVEPLSGLSSLRPKRNLKLQLHSSDFGWLVLGRTRMY